MGEAKRRQTTGQPSPKHLRNQRNRRLAWAAGIVSVTALVVLVLLLVTPGVGPSPDLPEADPTADPFPAELDQYGVQLGSPDAPVVVREFADYQCPACARFAEVHQDLKSEYIDTGKVRLVFFELPLRQHDNAMPAAQAARCAGDQEAYWQMHEQLFTDQDRWSESQDPLPVFLEYARELGMNEGRFRRCMTTEFRRENVEEAMEVARQLRITGTPTVLVDNIPLRRANWQQLAGVIERQLEELE